MEFENLSFVIFDRDGTLIEHVHQLVDPSVVKLKLELVSALFKLFKYGFRFGIRTNQSIFAQRIATSFEADQINKIIKSSSKYAFNLILRKPDMKVRDQVQLTLRKASIEFRRGLSGWENEIRQPYLGRQAGILSSETMPVTDHVDHFDCYIANYSELDWEKIVWLGEVLEGID